MEENNECEDKEPMDPLLKEDIEKDFENLDNAINKEEIEHLRREIEEAKEENTTLKKVIKKQKKVIRRLKNKKEEYKYDSLKFESDGKEANGKIRVLIEESTKLLTEKSILEDILRKTRKELKHLKKQKSSFREMEKGSLKKEEVDKLLKDLTDSFRIEKKSLIEEKEKEINEISEKKQTIIEKLTKTEGEKFQFEQELKEKKELIIKQKKKFKEKEKVLMNSINNSVKSTKSIIFFCFYFGIALLSYLVISKVVDDLKPILRSILYYSYLIVMVLGAVFLAGIEI